MLRGIACLLTLACFASLACAQPALDVTVTVDFGADRGQNLGTLFEALNDAGQHIAGAGFSSVVNSGRRLERQRLEFFVKPTAAGDDSQVQKLPRLSEQIGCAVFDLGPDVFGHDGTGVGLYRYSRAGNTWESTPSRSYIQRVRGKVLELAAGGVSYDGKEILPAPAQGRLGSLYYGQGYLFFYHYDRNGAAPFNRISAVPWDAYADAPVDWSKVQSIDATVLAEFAYCYGQLDGAVVNCSNWGGFYVFRNGAWSILRKPDPKTNYQIYCMMNFEDRLLLGHYPAGVFYSYDGQSITEQTDWPPTPAAVSSKLREAQSVALYRGELYTGVWPWGELWRYDRDAQQWTLVQRMFTVPTPQNTIVHPFEEEARAAGLVHNLLGQRVPALLPVGSDLFITTASKSSMFDNLEQLRTTFGSDVVAEYGQLHRLHRPGSISALITWKDQPTTLRFLADGERLVIFQDGQELASTPFAASLLSDCKPARYQWGSGLFGALGGSIQAHQPQ